MTSLGIEISADHKVGKGIEITAERTWGSGTVNSVRPFQLQPGPVGGFDVYNLLSQHSNEKLTGIFIGPSLLSSELAFSVPSSPC